MDSSSPPHDSPDAKNAFRKPSGDAASRNYRRRSPVEGSPSPDGSPLHKHSSSPNRLKEDSVQVSHHHSRKYHSRDQERQYGKNHSGRSSDSFRHSDRQSSRSSYGQSRHDKHADEDRYHERVSSRSGHESKVEQSREESESRSKDYQRTVDKYSRDKYDRANYRSKEKDRETYSEYQKYKDKDSSHGRSGSGRRHAPYDDIEKEKGTKEWDGRDERRDSYRSCNDYISDRDWSESGSQRDDLGSQRETGKYRLKEACKSELKELDGQNLQREEKRKYGDCEIIKDKDQDTRKAKEQFDNDDKDSSGKKPKLFGVDKDDSYGKDDEKKTSNLKLSHDSKASRISGFDVGNDVDAAKVAAMKAAELVNKNLVGVGMTTDQKKKLLWGSKKSSVAEESGHRWDTSMFFDRERQEKFNKLMGVKGEAKVEQKSDNQNGNDALRAEKQKELQLDLEKQYTAGLRRRDGRTVGLGL